MGYQILPNNPAAGSPLTAPTRPDGGAYPWCMYYRGDAEVAFADTPTDLLCALLPDYATLTPTDAAVARIELGTAAATIIQAHVLAEADPASLTEADRTTLTAPRIGADAPHPEWWTCPVPLIVVTTAYTPYTDLPRPASGISDTADAPNLWWVRPDTEETLLTSLHEIGYLRLMHATD